MSTTVNLPFEQNSGWRRMAECSPAKKNAFFSIPKNRRPTGPPTRKPTNSDASFLHARLFPAALGRRGSSPPLCEPCGGEVSEWRALAMPSSDLSRVGGGVGGAGSQACGSRHRTTPADPTSKPASNYHGGATGSINTRRNHRRRTRSPEWLPPRPWSGAGDRHR